MPYDKVLAISSQEPVVFRWDDDDAPFALDQHAKLDFHSANSLKQQSENRLTDLSLRHIIPIPN
jgi:hypothetical protein